MPQLSPCVNCFMNINTGIVVQKNFRRSITKTIAVVIIEEFLIMGKLDAISRQLVNMRRFQLQVSIGLQVSPALIIGEDLDEVGWGCRLKTGCKQQKWKNKSYHSLICLMRTFLN